MNYVHHVPGRLRLRSPLIKGDPGRAKAACATVTALPGVRAAKASTVTGSLTILYDPALTGAATVAEALHAGGHLPECPQVSAEIRIDLDAAASMLGEKVGQAALSFAIEKVMERSALAVFAALI